MGKSSQDQHCREEWGSTSMEGVLELGGAIKVILMHHFMWSPQERESDLGADSSLAVKQSPGKDSAEPWMPTLPAAGGISASVLGLGWKSGQCS